MLVIAYPVANSNPLPPQNRELQIMRIVRHPNIVELKAFYYSNGERVCRSPFNTACLPLASPQFMLQPVLLVVLPTCLLTMPWKCHRKMKCT